MAQPATCPALLSGQDIQLQATLQHQTKQQTNKQRWLEFLATILDTYLVLAVKSWTNMHLRSNTATENKIVLKI